MGLFRRAASAVNRADPVASAVIALSPSIRRVDRLIERGTPANGVITGIRFSLNDSTVRKEFAVSVQTPNGWQRIGVRTQPTAAHRLRLGVPVVVKLDGDRGALDWDAMAEAWGIDGASLSQDSLRRPPDDGVVDTALDARVQRHLAKWTRTDRAAGATIGWTCRGARPDIAGLGRCRPRWTHEAQGVRAVAERLADRRHVHNGAGPRGEGRCRRRSIATTGDAPASS